MTHPWTHFPPSTRVQLHSFSGLKTGVCDLGVFCQICLLIWIPSSVTKSSRMVRYSGERFTGFPIPRAVSNICLKRAINWIFATPIFVVLHMFFSSLVSSPVTKKRTSVYLGLEQEAFIFPHRYHYLTEIKQWYFDVKTYKGCYKYPNPMGVIPNLVITWIQNIC